MQIAVDAMGGDYAPKEVVGGTVEAATTLGIEISLVGTPEALQQELAKHSSAPLSRIHVVPASQVIMMDERPLLAVRQKPDSSIMVGLNLVKSGAAQAFVSAGNTGAVMAAALLTLGRMAAIERPAIGAALPTVTGSPVLLLDVGANAECRPTWLVQFAEMGSTYSARVLSIERPRVALLNIGEEESKGNRLTLETYALLQGSKLNFIGNIEGKDLPRGIADVVVTDGFTGNVLLKAAEGLAEFILAEIQGRITSRWHYKLAALALRPAFRHVVRRLDYSQYGGAPLLGVNGVVIIAHGRSKAPAVRNAIRVARDAVAQGLLEAVNSTVTPVGFRHQ